MKYKTGEYVAVWVEVSGYYDSKGNDVIRMRPNDDRLTNLGNK